MHQQLKGTKEKKIQLEVSTCTVHVEYNKMHYFVPLVDQFVVINFIGH